MHRALLHLLVLPRHADPRRRVETWALVAALAAALAVSCAPFSTSVVAPPATAAAGVPDAPHFR